jgi:hypothetical protein
MNDYYPECTVESVYRWGWGEHVIRNQAVAAVTSTRPHFRSVNDSGNEQTLLHPPLLLKTAITAATAIYRFNVIAPV